MAVEDRIVAITTVDNPYDPVDQFEQWMLFDELHRYHTCPHLARIAITSNLMSEEEQDHALEMAIDEIVLNDPTGLYKKVVKHVKNS